MNNTKQQTFNINIDSLPIARCKGCDSRLWQPAFELRRISPIYSKSGKPELVGIQKWICAKCGLEIDKEPVKIVEANNENS